MKKTYSLAAFVLLFGVFLCSCSAPAKTDSETLSPSASSPAPAVSSAASEPEVTRTQEIAFAYPGNFTWPAPYLHTADGLYEIKAVFEGGSNIFYYDYQTRTQLFYAKSRTARTTIKAASLGWNCRRRTLLHRCSCGRVISCCL